MNSYLSHPNSLYQKPNCSLLWDCITGFINRALSHSFFLLLVAFRTWTYNQTPLKLCLLKEIMHFVPLSGLISENFYSNTLQDSSSACLLQIKQKFILWGFASGYTIYQPRAKLRLHFSSFYYSLSNCLSSKQIFHPRPLPSASSL